MSDSMVTAQAKFAFDLLRGFEENNSVVISPISISIALSMALIGAKNNTAKEIQNAIAKGVSIDELHKYFSNIYYSIKENDIQSSLKMANRVYFSNDLSIKDAFKNGIIKYYGGEFELENFVDSEKVAKDISKFVADSTNNVIQNLVKADDFSENTKLVLINAIHFEKNWTTPFNLQSFKPIFYSSPNVAKEISMMELSDNCRYFENKDYQFLELSYEGLSFSMFLILPKERFGLTKMLKNLDITEILDLMSTSSPIHGRIVIPKFDVGSTIELSNILQKLNINDAFDASKADFSGTACEAIAVSKVLHKAFIQISEEGTKAAAATFIQYDLVCYEETPEESFQFIANHPFLYLIADNAKNIYFIGTFYN